MKFYRKNQSCSIHLSEVLTMPPTNGFTTIYATLAAYTFYPEKPLAVIIPIFQLHYKNSLKIK